MEVKDKELLDKRIDTILDAANECLDNGVTEFDHDLPWLTTSVNTLKYMINEMHKRGYNVTSTEVVGNDVVRPHYTLMIRKKLSLRYELRELVKDATPNLVKELFEALRDECTKAAKLGKTRYDYYVTNEYSGEVVKLVTNKLEIAGLKVDVLIKPTGRYYIIIQW